MTTRNAAARYAILAGALTLGIIGGGALLINGANGQVREDPRIQETLTEPIPARPAGTNPVIAEANYIIEYPVTDPNGIFVEFGVAESPWGRRTGLTIADKQTIYNATEIMLRLEGVIQ